MPEAINVVIAVIFFAILSAILAVVIVVCSKVFYVKDDPRFENVLKNLPGANCGGCGHPGCAGLANAIIKDGVKPSACKPIKKEQIDLIEEYLKKTTGPNGEYIEQEA